MNSKAVNELVALFSKFPSLGPRQAARIIYAITDLPSIEQQKIADLISRLGSEVSRCNQCFWLCKKNATNSKNILCSICGDNNRAKNLIMVVEKDADLETIERTKLWSGAYHVLGGTFDPLENEETQRLRVKQLYMRVKKLPSTEIVIATSATKEGDLTAVYLTRILEPLKVKITRLGRGLSSGNELEYVDEHTLKNALENRK